MTPDEILAALAAIQARNMQSLTAPQAAPARRTRWSGPMPNRPVVDGKAMVTAEELADFRRQFGAEKTLRDLLNADRGAMPAAAPEADMRARGRRNPRESYSLEGYSPEEQGEIPRSGMAGPAAEGRIPGEVERNLMNALMAISPMLGGMPAGMFARNALAQAPGAPVPVGMTAQMVRDPRSAALGYPRSAAPMQLPMPAQLIRDPRSGPLGARAPMQLPQAYIPGVTR